MARSPITEQDIADILGTGGIDIVFQPLWDLRGPEVVGFEALSRFPHGEPVEWFAAARRYGYGEELDQLAVLRALSQFREAPPGAVLFANLDTARMVPGIEEQPHRTVMELTERLPWQRGEGRSFLAAAAGVPLAVDDVGSRGLDGDRIRLFAPDFVKLDRQLIWRVCRDQDAAALAELGQYCGAAEAMGAETLAEGVEELAWLPVLFDHGVHLAQGFALGRPEPMAVWRDGKALAAIADRIRSLRLTEEGEEPADEALSTLRRLLRGWQEELADEVASEAGAFLGPDVRRRLLAVFLESLGRDVHRLSPSGRAALRALAADPTVVARGPAFLAAPVARVLERHGEADGFEAVVGRGIERLAALLQKTRLKGLEQEMAQLRTELRQGQAEAGLFAHLEERALKARNEPALFDLLALEARDRLDAALAVVVVPGAEGFRVVAAAGNGAPIAVGQEWPPGHSLEGAVITTGVPFRGGAEEGGRLWQSDPRGDLFAVAMAVALTIGEEMLGAVSVWRKDQRPFTEEDEAFLARLASRTAGRVEILRDVARHAREVREWQELDACLRARALGLPEREVTLQVLRSLKLALGADYTALVEIRDGIPAVLSEDGELPLSLVNQVLAALPRPAGRWAIADGEALVRPLPSRRRDEALLAVARSGKRLSEGAVFTAERFAFLLAMGDQGSAGATQGPHFGGGESALRSRLQALGERGEKALLVFLHSDLDQAVHLLPPSVDLFLLGPWVAGLCRSSARDVRAHLTRAMAFRDLHGAARPLVRFLVWEGEDLEALLARLPVGTEADEPSVEAADAWPEASQDER